KVRHFLKHNYLPNTGNIHSRALTFVCLLFVIYVNNWITHLKIEKIHLVTLNESNHEINIEEYPITFYGKNHIKLNDYQQFYTDLDKYAQNYEKMKILSTFIINMNDLSALSSSLSSFEIIYINLLKIIILMMLRILNDSSL
ncbi:unnamed protein product, partial [Rotaria sp. Silwood1]